MPIDYTVGVASPLKETVRARTAQRVLNGDNVFGKDFLQGAVDGVFGEETGRACIRAKYWLGYPTADLKPTYGPTLDMFLHGLAQPDAAMVKRTAARQKKAKQVPMRVKALAKLETKLGYVEGANNDSIFGAWYGLNHQPYCAMAVTWAYVLVGSKGFAKGSRYAYCPYIYNDAKAGRNGLSVTREPQPGDVVLFNWDGDWDADHVGLFREWKDRKSGLFCSTEANTSPDDGGSQSNGGGVYRRGEKPGTDTRRAAQVQAFVRVGR